MKTPHSSFGPAALFAGVLAALTYSPGGAIAAPAQWINSGAGSFGVAANWDTNLVPTTGDTATVSNLGTVQIGAGDFFSPDAFYVTNGGLEQTGGDLVTTGDLMLGNLLGEVTFNQTGGTLSAGTRLFFGNGEGSATPLSSVTGTVGGTMTANDFLIVGRQGGTADITVTGLLRKIGTTSRLVVGDRNLGVGILTVSGFGQVLSDTAIDIGNNNNSNGTIIAKDDAQVTSTTNFIVGGGPVDGGAGSANNGVGQLTVSDRAVVTANGQIWVGNNTGSSGTVDVNGGTLRGSSWIAVGRRGTGVMTVNGGLVDKTGANHFVVGDLGGNGTLRVTNGTVAVNAELRVGSGANSVGLLDVQGGSVTTQSWLAIGRDVSGVKGTGTFNLSGGTVVKDGIGNLTLNGVNSTVNQSGGTLTVVPSDAVNVGETWMSEFAGSQSTWNATGGEANLGKMTRIGYAGNATVNVSESAVMNNGIVYMGSNGPSTGTLNLNGGTFAARYIEEGAGNGFINFNGGTLKVTEDRLGGNSASLLPDFEDSDLNVQSGGLKVDTSGFVAEIVQALSGIGGLFKDGQGELILSNAATSYAGDTRIGAGTLSVVGPIFNDFSSIYITVGGVMNLSFIGMDDVGALWLNGVFQEAGTYGGIGSGAMFQSDDFIGTGVLNVAAIPEPGTVGLLLGGLGLVALRLRRKSA